MHARGVVFPDPPLLTPNEGPRNVDFSFIVSGSERTFTFRVSLNTLPTLATLVRDVDAKPRLTQDEKCQKLILKFRQG